MEPKIPFFLENPVEPIEAREGFSFERLEEKLGFSSESRHTEVFRGWRCATGLMIHRH